jgi:hypothetical protein
MFVYHGVRFCTDTDSPEVILAFFMPMLIIYYSSIIGIGFNQMLIYAVLTASIIYLGITILKNIAARYMKSEQNGKIMCS